LQRQRILRERVWAAAHVGLTSITLDTDTTVHTLYGRQVGARKGYNPKNKGKKSYQPILTFIAETHEYVGGFLAKHKYRLQDRDAKFGLSFRQLIETDGRARRLCCRPGVQT
jgi:hypothetical protein